MPTVSIIVPTYNNAPYLKDSLSSIINQTFKNFEIIVVDDGSTDKTKEIVKNFDSKIKYICQSNQGLAVARNTGIQNSTGKYLTFLDGDDLWEGNNLEIKIKILEGDESLDAVFSNFYLFNERGITSDYGIIIQYPIFSKRNWTFKDIFSEKNLIKSNSKFNNIEYFKGNIFIPLLFGNMINACSIIFKKECQEKIGLFKADLRTQQDYEYWLRFSKNFDIGYIDIPLVSYRRHASQLTAHKNMVRIVKNVTDILNPYYKERFDILPKEFQNKFQRRFSNVYLSLGMSYLGIKENYKARKAFETSFQSCKLNFMAYTYWIFSFFPTIITHNLRFVARNFIKKVSALAKT